MTTVGLIPAYRAEATIAETIRAVRPLVDHVVVVDDGSPDATAAAAEAAGASVVRLDRNLGKAHAVAAGLAASPDADHYLLVDSDLGATAVGLAPLLGPVRSGAADMAIGRLPVAGRRGGFGTARRLAEWGIRRATGWQAKAPLSGQRAVRGALLRALYAGGPPGDRFGLEVALTIEALRQGARLVEVPVEVDHHHRGRTLGGFAHRGQQAADIARALWPRLTSPALRVGLMLLAFLAASVLVHIGADSAEPVSVPLVAPPAPTGGPVLLVGMPGLEIADLQAMPHLRRLAGEGVTGALTVRTRVGFPSTVEGYATLGAGSRVDALAPAGQAFNATEPLEGGQAADALERRSGTRPDGEVVVVGFPAALRQSGQQVSSLPGALGQALEDAGLTTAVVGNADVSRPRIIDDPQLGPPDPEEPVVPDVSRPAAIALADSDGGVDLGRVDSDLLTADPLAPFGLRADDQKVVAATAAAIEAGADVVLVDPGDLDRAQRFTEFATASQAAAHRREARARIDSLLPELLAAAGPRASALIFGITPPAKRWHLTPLVIHGPGIEPGGLVHSPSTRRPGVATLTDLAPTILSFSGIERPEGMIGHSLRRNQGPATSTGDKIAALVHTDEVAEYRESIYLGSTMAYIVFQALLYLLALWVFTRFGRRGRSADILRLGVLAVAAHPVGTFLHRAVPGIETFGPAGVALLPVIGLTLAAAALRLGRRDPVAPLGWIAALTVGVLAADAATGEHLQMSSLLGYSFHSAGRFTGFGNTAFAILAATTVLAAAIHVHRAPRRGEALVAVGLLFAFVILLDGSPALGSDVGGILTLVPVFGLTLLALSGRRVSARAVVVAGALTGMVLALAVGFDLARPAPSRTHLGRLVGEILDSGAEPLIETVVRKGATNLRTWGSPWVWGLGVLAISLITAVVMDRGWLRIVPRGSALRAGLLGTLGAGVLGYAVNDSGVVVAALVLVYLGPFLTLIALDAVPPLAPTANPITAAAPALDGESRRRVRR